MAGRPPKPKEQKKDKMSFTLDSDLLCNLVKAAKKEGISVSAYTNEQLRDKLKM